MTEEVKDRNEAINQAFHTFCTEQASVMIANHGAVRGAVLVAIDGNGYISVASFGTSPTGVNLLLTDALELNRRRQPDVEVRLQAGQQINELAPTATAGDAPVLAIEADAAEVPPQQH